MKTQQEYTINTKTKGIFELLFTLHHKKIDKEFEKIVEDYDKEGYKILEIGSGTKSRKKQFKNAKFTATDIILNYGVDSVQDVTNLKLKDKEFDLVLCENVLEHIYNHQKAIKEMYRVLKKGGKTFIVTPFSFPLHDEPYDYFRYTRHSYEKMLSIFKKVSIKQIPLMFNFGLFKKIVLYYLVVGEK
jgi:SAM-dependent methyltransferase